MSSSFLNTFQLFPIDLDIQTILACESSNDRNYFFHQNLNIKVKHYYLQLSQHSRLFLFSVFSFFSLNQIPDQCSHTNCCSSLFIEDLTRGFERFKEKRNDGEDITQIQEE